MRSFSRTSPTRPRVLRRPVAREQIAEADGGRSLTSESRQTPSPEWFTQQLLGGPALSQGAVLGVELLDRKPAGAMGSVHSVALVYSSDSTGERPTRVVLKRTRPDVDFSASEVRFYRELAPKLAPGTVPRCFGSVYDEQKRQYALVLEDLSGSHECLLGPGLAPIGPSRVGAMMDCLAALHASWWERPLEGFGRRAADPARTTRKMLPVLGRTYPEVCHLFGDLLLPRHDALYRRYFAERGPSLLARLEGRRGFALLHGDAHVGNVLFPRQGSAGGPVLIDWGVFRVGPALWDVSFPLMWTAPSCWKREASESLLGRYHEGLVAHGVRDYPFDRCVRDFREALLDNLRAPIGQLATEQIPRAVPLGAHVAAMALIDAWDCETLLE